MAGSSGIQSHAFGKGGPLRCALMLSHVEQRAAPTWEGSTACISSLLVRAVHTALRQSLESDMARSMGRCTSTPILLA